MTMRERWEGAMDGGEGAGGLGRCGEPRVVLGPGGGRPSRRRVQGAPGKLAEIRFVGDGLLCTVARGSAVVRRGCDGAASGKDLGRR